VTGAPPRWASMESRNVEEDGFVSIIRIGLGENKKYAAGWDAIFGGGKKQEEKKEKPAKKKPAKAAAKKPAAKKKAKKK
jgi:hypothetical protein